jgi:hypothetical protein
VDWHFAYYSIKSDKQAKQRLIIKIVVAVTVRGRDTRDRSYPRKVYVATARRFRKKRQGFVADADLCWQAPGQRTSTCLRRGMPSLDFATWISLFGYSDGFGAQ